MEKPTQQKIHSAEQSIAKLTTRLKDHESALRNFNQQLSNRPNDANLKQRIDGQVSAIQNIKESLLSYESIFEWDLITTDTVPEGQIRVVEGVPKSIILKDYRQTSQMNAKMDSESTTKLGIDGLANGTLAYIRDIQTHAFNATHQDSRYPDADKKHAKQSGVLLEELIDKFLNAKLERSIEGEPLLFKKQVFEAGLSNGQIILLQLCVQIHAQGGALDNLIIFMDEPENHLHPAASIDMVDAIKKAAPQCQIWIATHSLPILSYFNDATLLFVDDGAVTFSGSTPERVLNNLVGGDERIQKIRDFTSLPSVYAMNRYAAECLLPPTVVPASERDAQTAQIQALIGNLNRVKGENALRIIDYGAGKGRLLESLSIEKPNLANSIDYVAYDEFKDDAAYCKKVIESVYGDSLNRYYNKHNKLTAKHGKASFDLIVLCNVLHEIDPNDWLKLFSKDGEITSLLSNQGVVFLVEDEEIPVGEMAHTKGFIVFDTTELRTLFRIKNNEDFVFSDQRNDGRLKAHIVPKEWLQRITAISRKKSMNDRKNRALKEIVALRNKSPNYKNGRKHSFWVQQLANAELALSEL